MSVFHETQTLRNPWIRGLICLGAAALAGDGLWALYSQLVLGRPWTSPPLAPGWLLVVVGVMFALAGALVWAAFRLTLEVEVGHGQILIRYWPFVRKNISVAEIREAEAVTYSPLREYGGWGIRWGGPKRGWAYNVWGNRGVRLEMAKGKRLLLGSQKAEELAQAIAQEKNQPVRAEALVENINVETMVVKLQKENSEKIP